MEDLEDKINSLFSSPESMERIMQLARTLSGNDKSGSSASSQDKESDSGGVSETLGSLDPRMLSLLTGAMKEFSSPSETERLISSIKPYLSAGRLEKVDKAMSIARLAKVAKKVLPEFGGSGHV